MKELLEILWSFTKIGMLGFGGGSAVAPLIHAETVEKKKWITEDEFLDIVTVANSLPGPSMAEMATAIGYKKRGWSGALIASLGIILPMMIVFTLLMYGLLNVMPASELENITNPVLVVVAALMLSLSKKFFLQAKVDLKTINIVLISLVTCSAILYIPGFHPSYALLIVIVSVFIFTKGGGKLDV